MGREEMVRGLQGSQTLSEKEFRCWGEGIREVGQVVHHLSGGSTDGMDVLCL